MSRFKGTGHDFFLVRNTYESFSDAMKKQMNQKKQQNPYKIAEIMKEKGYLVHIIRSVVFLIS